MPIQHGAEVNPFVAPKGDPAGPSLPGNPWAANVKKAPFIPTEPLNEPKDYHAGPVGGPTEVWWRQNSSEEKYRQLNQQVLSSDEGPPYQDAMRVPAVRPLPPEDTPPPVSRIMRAPSPGYSELERTDFGRRFLARFTGEHASMAAAVRRYPVRGMTTVSETRRNTYRLPPPTLDETRTRVPGPVSTPAPPAQQMISLISRTNGGSWRLA